MVTVKLDDYEREVLAYLHPIIVKPWMYEYICNGFVAYLDPSEVYQEIENDWRFLHGHD